MTCQGWVRPHKRENLREHMTDLELIFGMLGEASTTEIARTHDAQGFQENKKSAHKGGHIAGNARKQLETETGKKVSTKGNYIETKNLGRGRSVLLELLGGAFTLR